MHRNQSALKAVIALAVILALNLSIHAQDEPLDDSGAYAKRVHAQKEMVREIRDVLVESRDKIEVLNRDFDTAIHEVDAAIIQAEIGEIKLASDIQILEIQLRYARLAGLASAVNRLESALEKTRESRRHSSSKVSP